MNDSNWDSYWGEEKDLEHWQRPSKSVLDLIERTDPDKHQRVLDLGCGIGRHSIALADEDFHVTALDGSERALNDLRKRIADTELKIDIVQGDYLKQIFPDDSFDIILSYNVIYHCYREEFERAVELCKKYLKTDGIFFFTCPTREDGKYGNGEEVAPHTYRSENSVHPGDIHYFADEEEIRSSLEGLEIISLKKEGRYWENDGKKQFSSYWIVETRNR